MRATYALPACRVAHIISRPASQARHWRPRALVEGAAWLLATQVLARAAKADRLRQAKQEAEREVKAYKAQREEQYQKRIADVRAPPAAARGSDLFTALAILPRSVLPEPTGSVMRPSLSGQSALG